MSMFRREDIIFENDKTYSGSMLSNKEIIDAVYEASLHFIDLMNITSLKKIIIKQMAIFESTLGTARNFGEKAIIELAYVTAVNLKYDPQRNDKELHKIAMATLCHEFCHVRDFELIWKKLVKDDFNMKHEMELGFDVWTEFFATYNSFIICEDDLLYDSFKKSFQNKDGNRSYYASRVLGYYLNKGHSVYCDQLVETYLIKQEVNKLVKCLGKMISAYADISKSDLIECAELIKRTYERSFSLNALSPINSRGLPQKWLRD